jgi:hypothetical protein
MTFNTIPSANTGHSFKPTGTEIGSKIYTIYFTYGSASSTYSLSLMNNIEVSIGSEKYYLPLHTDTNLHRFIVTTSSYPSTIKFSFTKLATGTAQFDIGNFQVVEGYMFSDILVDDVVPTNKIYFNNNISKMDDGTGTNTLVCPETRITKMNLDNIFQLLPFAYPIEIIGNDNLNLPDPNKWSTTISNLQIFFISGTMENQGNPGSSPGFNTYQTSITYPINYKPIFATFQMVSSIGAFYLNTFCPITIDTATSTIGNMVLKQYRSNSTGGQTLDANYPYVGIIVAQKTS